MIAGPLTVFTWGLLVATASAYKYLFIASNFAYSHTAFDARLAEILQEHGHHVDVLLVKVVSFVKFTSDKLNITEIEPPRMHEVTEIMKTMKMYGDVFNHDAFAMSNADVHIMKLAMSILCQDMIQDEKFNRLLADGHYDGFFTENQDLCTRSTLALRQLGPTFLVSPLPLSEVNSYTLGIPNLPSFTPVMNFAPVSGVRMDFWERVANLYNHWDYNHRVRPIFSDRALFAHTLPADQPEPDQLVRATTVQFLNTNEFLDLPLFAHAKLRFIGGVAIGPTQPLSPELSAIVAKARQGVVLFSLGSLADSSRMPQAIIGAFARAFAHFPQYEFVWKFNGQVNSTSANTHIVHWVDQVSLLNHASTKLFITHAGLNSVNEAAFAGVPMVTVPLFGDQKYNSAAVRHHGIGVYLSKFDLTEDNIVRAIRSALTDTEMRGRCERMSHLLRHLPESPVRRFVSTVEQATEFPQLFAQLTHPAGEMDFIRYFSLDVIGFLAASALLLAYLAYATLRLLYRTLRSQKAVLRKKCD